MGQSLAYRQMPFVGHSVCGGGSSKHNKSGIQARLDWEPPHLLAIYLVQNLLTPDLSVQVSKMQHAVVKEGKDSYGCQKWGQALVRKMGTDWVVKGPSRNVNVLPCNDTTVLATIRIFPSSS